MPAVEAIYRGIGPELHSVTQRSMPSPIGHAAGTKGTRCRAYNQALLA